MKKRAKEVFGVSQILGFKRYFLTTVMHADYASRIDITISNRAVLDLLLSLGASFVEFGDGFIVFPSVLPDQSLI